MRQDTCAPSAFTSLIERIFVVDITEQDRPARIAQAMPMFQQCVEHWQRETGLAVGQPVLVGFSQGAIMTLESTQTGERPLGARVVSLAGHFATPVRSDPPGLKYHLIHGTQDGVVSPQFAQQVGAQLAALDMLEGLGHPIDARELAHLLGYIGDNTQ